MVKRLGWFQVPLSALLGAAVFGSSGCVQQHSIGPGTAAATFSPAYPHELRLLEGAGEQTAVEQAVLDYVEALYEVDPARIERSVHPTLAKVGFHRPRTGLDYRELRMDYEELHRLAAEWNRDGRVDPKTAVKEITVLDMLDRTATAKLTADWGVDYLHLAKYDGRWRIVNVLWQSLPPAADR